MKVLISKASLIQIIFLENVFSHPRSAGAAATDDAAAAAATAAAATVAGRPVLDALDVTPPLAQVLRPRLCALDVEVDFPPLRVQRIDFDLKFGQHFGIGLEGALQGLQI